MQLQPQIEQAIRDNFQIDYMDLQNESHMHAGPANESHFKLTLVSEDFEGVSKVKRQQAVYRALNELMPQFHALALHTYSPEEWQAVGVAPASPKCGGGH
ncbi:BolA family transcriptional regulator [Thiomicrorhabdus sp. ZW0627]|uniref:BolA family protein n=1 Tax=Thiomicrorhabdus sp. ZW0627 TaxID=3039774 RepID=UPI00243709A4|nr:BolA family transcriptional regulator [Thiomicrorhabdus sp. ZW0627]MDG6773524.1 BolA family transcriptional regulator [Thiomicrorhabdus sp. ZW0627]